MAIKVDNEQVLKDAIGVYAKRARRQVAKLMEDAAEATIDYIDRMFQPLEKKGGNDEFPIWDGDLRDSTGVGVYMDGRLVRFKLSPFAKYGTQWLDSAFDEALSEYSGKDSYYVQLFSAVPYAEEITTQGSPMERGIGYFENISEFMKSWVNARVNYYVTGK